MLFFFRFESNLPYSDQLPVRLISDQVLSHVEFRSSPDPTAKNLLSKLSFRFSSVNVDHTVTSTNRDSRNSNDTSLFTELSLVAEVIEDQMMILIQMKIVITVMAVNMVAVKMEATTVVW